MRWGGREPWLCKPLALQQTPTNSACARPPARRPAGEEVAIKLIPLGERFYAKYVEREIRNHRRLVHPHIVQFKEVFVTPQASASLFAGSRFLPLPRGWQSWWRCTGVDQCLRFPFNSLERLTTFLPMRCSTWPS